MTQSDRVGFDPMSLFESQRSRLMGIAYGILGSTMEAEDVVQDAFLRWQRVDPATVDSPAAYLTTITTRLAIDVLRSAQRRRESYVGPWLPEPVVTRFDDDPGELVAEAERLSLRLLSALERLNPVERAVLVLREVFDMDYTEIADVVDKSPANCRQIATRARKHAGDTSRRIRTDAAVEQEVLAEYLSALSTGDVDRLAEVFAADVVLWTDGGGKVRAARHSLTGAWRVARHLVGVSGQVPDDLEVRVVRCNGDPALLGVAGGLPVGLLSFEIADGSVIAVRAQLNPDKLESRLARISQ